MPRRAAAGLLLALALLSACGRGGADLEAQRERALYVTCLTFLERAGAPDAVVARVRDRGPEAFHGITERDDAPPRPLIPAFERRCR